VIHLNLALCITGTWYSTGTGIVSAQHGSLINKYVSSFLLWVRYRTLDCFKKIFHGLEDSMKNLFYPSVSVFRSGTDDPLHPTGNWWACPCPVILVPHPIRGLCGVGAGELRQHASCAEICGQKVPHPNAQQLQAAVMPPSVTDHQRLHGGGGHGLNKNSTMTSGSFFKVSAWFM
jgi:hypothetical protein